MYSQCLLRTFKNKIKSINAFYFISNTFISNGRLKFANFQSRKNIENWTLNFAKQHLSLGRKKALLIKKACKRVTGSYKKKSADQCLCQLEILISKDIQWRNCVLICLQLHLPSSVGPSGVRASGNCFCFSFVNPWKWKKSFVIPENSILFIKNVL